MLPSSVVTSIPMVSASGKCAALTWKAPIIEYEGSNSTKPSLPYCLKPDSHLAMLAIAGTSAKYWRMRVSTSAELWGSRVAKGFGASARAKSGKANANKSGTMIRTFIS